MILPRVVLEVAPASRWWVSSVGRKSNIYFTRERDRRCWIGKTDKRAIKQEFLGGFISAKFIRFWQTISLRSCFSVKVHK